MVTVTSTVKVSGTPEITLSFDTRAEALLAQTGSSKFIQIGELRYTYDPSGTALTTGDGRTWSPAGEATLAHFPDRATANAYAVANGVPLLDTDYTAGKRFYDGVVGAPPNANYSTGLIRSEVVKEDTGSNRQAISAFLDVNPTTHDADTVGFGIYSSARASVDTSTYRGDAVGVGGQGFIKVGNAAGRAWGALFDAAIPAHDPGTPTDGRLNGIEVACSNFGGSEETDPDSLLAKINILLACAHPTDDPSAARNTAGLVFPLNSVGWWDGIVLSSIENRYIRARAPSVAGATFAEIEPSGNWDSELLTFPLGKGLATWNSAGTAKSLMLAGADNGTVAQFSIPVRLSSSGSNSLLLAQRTDTPGAPRNFFELRASDQNGSGTSKVFAKLFAGSTNITAGSEAGAFIFETMKAGVLTEQLRVSASGVAMRNLPTSSAGLAAGQVWNDAGTMKIV